MSMHNKKLPIPQSSLSTYLVEINRFSLLSKEEEFALALRYREGGDIQAAHQLVTSNLRFVVKIAYEYVSYGLKMADLIQEGNIGLMTAVKKFDPKKGYRLISYAVWWIRAYIQNFILKSWSLVKMGTTQAQRKLFYKLGQVKRALMVRGDSFNEEACEELAKNLKIKDDAVIEMEARLRARDLSLDSPVDSESDTTHLEMMSEPATQEEAVMAQEESYQLKGKIQKALKGLSPKELFIVNKRLMAEDPWTLQQIGEYYQVSRERARQIEERTKAKIREALQE